MNPGQSARREFLVGVSGTVACLLASSGSALAQSATPPDADFSYSPQSPSPDEQVVLDGSSSTDPDGQIEDYAWEIEQANGVTERKYGSQVTYAWDSGGSYDVTLTVTDNGGNTDSVTRVVDVENTSPTANFSHEPLNPSPEQEVTLNGGPLSDDPDGQIEDYAWEIEQANGVTERKYGSQVTYAWDSGGSYDVTLTVTDNGGKTDSNTKTIDVDNSAPNPKFSYSPEYPSPGEEVTFDGSSSTDPDGQIEDYTWEIEQANGVTERNYGSQVAHTWEEDGTYDVTLKVSDNGGASSSVTESVIVGNTAPFADFSMSPEDPRVGVGVLFDATGSSDSENNIQSYKWVFTGPDGTTEKTGDQVVHSFSPRGEHTVELTVTDSAGATDTATETLFVGNRVPVPSVSYSPDDVTIETTVTFSAGGTTDPDGTVQEYRWRFPGGTELRGERVEYTFPTTGTKTVRLAVTDDEGRTATADVTVEVTAAQVETTAGSDSQTGGSSTSQRTRTDVGSGSQQSSAFPATDTPTAPGPEQRIRNDNSNLPQLLVGVLGLGGIGAAYYYLRDSPNSRAPSVADLQREADQLVEEAHHARDRGNYRDAISAYEEAIRKYEQARERLSQGDGVDATLAGAILDAEEQIEDTQKRLAQVTAVREPLQDAESGFQTAISEHARNERTAARRDYRQAKNKYDEALTALEQSDYDILHEEDGMTVSVNLETERLPELVVEWPYLSKAERDTLSNSGLGTLTDLKSAGDETITALEEQNEIDQTLADRLRAALWWQADDVRTYMNREAIERQRDRAETGHEMLQ